MGWLTKLFKTGKFGLSKPGISPFALLRDKSAFYGRYLDTGWIVQFKSPDVDFDAALKAGPECMAEYFSGAIGRLRVGHLEELQKLGFFAAVRSRTGLNVDVGTWAEIPAPELIQIIHIIEIISPQATPGMRRLLQDLHDMSRAAIADDCSIGFMLTP